MKKILVSMFILVVSFMLLSGCGSKANKENAIKYLSKMNEYVQSNEYKEFIRGAFKEGVGAGMTGTAVDEKKFEVIVEKKANEIAKSMGFTDSKELEVLVEKYKDDKDVKAQSELMLKSINDSVQEIVKEMTLKMQEQIQQSVTDAQKAP